MYHMVILLDKGINIYVSHLSRSVEIFVRSDKHGQEVYKMCFILRSYIWFYTFYCLKTVGTNLHMAVLHKL